MVKKIDTGLPLAASALSENKISNTWSWSIKHITKRSSDYFRYLVIFRSTVIDNVRFSQQHALNSISQFFLRHFKVIFYVFHPSISQDYLRQVKQVEENRIAALALSSEPSTLNEQETSDSVISGEEEFFDANDESWNDPIVTSAQPNIDPEESDISESVVVLPEDTKLVGMPVLEDSVSENSSDISTVPPKKTKEPSPALINFLTKENLEKLGRAFSYYLPVKQRKDFQKNITTLIETITSNEKKWAMLPAKINKRIEQVQFIKDSFTDEQAYSHWPVEKINKYQIVVSIFTNFPRIAFYYDTPISSLISGLSTIWVKKSPMLAQLATVATPLVVQAKSNHYSEIGKLQILLTSFMKLHSIYLVKLKLNELAEKLTKNTELKFEDKSKFEKELKEKREKNMADFYNQFAVVFVSLLEFYEQVLPVGPFEQKLAAIAKDVPKDPSIEKMAISFFERLVAIPESEFNNFNQNLI